MNSGKELADEACIADCGFKHGSNIDLEDLAATLKTKASKNHKPEKMNNLTIRPKSKEKVIKLNVRK